MRLNLVVPDILEAIFPDRAPSGPSLAEIGQALPVLWNEQRELFGFPPV